VILKNKFLYRAILYLAMVAPMGSGTTLAQSSVVQGTTDSYSGGLAACRQSSAPPDAKGEAASVTEYDRVKV